LSLKRSLIRGTQWVTRIGGTAMLGSLPSLRKAAGDGAMLKVEPQGLAWSDEVCDGVPCEWITPKDAPDDAVLLYFHGGGGVLGLYNSSRKIIGYIAAASKRKALLVDYRLAPEHPFPAGLEDCVTAYKWLLAQGIDAKKIVILGDSMGGYLTISALLSLRDQKLPLPAAAVGISPADDPTCSGESVRSNANKDALLSPRFMRTVTTMYVGNHPLSDPILSPLTADLTGLPPMLIQVGGDEILLDDARRFKERSLAFNMEVTLEVWPRMWHDWHICAPALDESMQAVENIAQYIGKKISG
jgi:epsilon-lactone hydrolase